PQAGRRGLAVMLRFSGAQGEMAIQQLVPSPRQNGEKVAAAG
ncbi:hypothetical protein SM0020_31499, partial [Sinorhizobium meliloti CCNWSX0020]